MATDKEYLDLSNLVYNDLLEVGEEGYDDLRYRSLPTKYESNVSGEVLLLRDQYHFQMKNGEMSWIRSV